MSDDTKKSEETGVDETEETDETEVDETEAKEDDWKPPSREDWEKQQASAKAARKEAADRRKWLKEHGIDPHTGKKAKSDTESAKDDEATAKVAAGEAKARRALTAAVRVALVGAGADRESADLLIGKVKFDDLDVEDDGTIDGLDDQLDELKTRYARLFEKDEPAPKRTKSVGGTVRKENVKAEKTYTQLLMEQARQ